MQPEAQDLTANLTKELGTIRHCIAKAAVAIIALTVVTRIAVLLAEEIIQAYGVHKGRRTLNP